LKRKHYLAVVKRISDAYLHDTLLIAASSMEVNHTTAIQQKKQFHVSHVANILPSKM